MRPLIFRKGSSEENSEEAKERNDKEEGGVREEGEVPVEDSKRKSTRKHWSSLFSLLGLAFGGTALLSILIKGFRILSGRESMYFLCRTIIDES